MPPEDNTKDLATGFLCLFIALVPVVLIGGLLLYAWTRHKQRARLEQIQWNARMRRWRMIEVGLERDKVLEILGHPDEISSDAKDLLANGATESWNYGILQGKVYFREGAVIGYKKPGTLSL